MSFDADFEKGGLDWSTFDSEGKKAYEFIGAA